MSKYYECHITVEPVFDERLELLRSISEANHFKVADLLMQKRLEDSPERSKMDTFTTARHKDYNTIFNQMSDCIYDLQIQGFKIWRYKIEDVLIDSKIDDCLGVFTNV